MLFRVIRKSVLPFFVVIFSTVSAASAQNC